MKALIVDDDPITVTLLAFMLHNEGVEVKYSLFIDDDFYKKLIEFKPDVIILDLFLNANNGFDVARKIREIKELSHIPLVAISASHYIDDKIKAFRAGFSDYIEKPIHKCQFLKLIKRYSSLHKALGLCDKVITNYNFVNSEGCCSDSTNPESNSSIVE